MRTVRDFKDVMEERFGGRRQFWNNRPEAAREFCEKLNRLGARNINTIPPETVPDIDATVTLSDEEWRTLEAELDSIA